MLKMGCLETGSPGILVGGRLLSHAGRGDIHDLHLRLSVQGPPQNPACAQQNQVQDWTPPLIRVHTSTTGHEKILSLEHNFFSEAQNSLLRSSRGMTNDQMRSIEKALAEGRYTLKGNDTETFAVTPHGWALLQGPDMRPGEGYQMSTLDLPDDLEDVEDPDLTSYLLEVFGR